MRYLIAMIATLVATPLYAGSKLSPDNLPLPVTVENTPSVSISGTPDVNISGTASVSVANQVATDPVDEVLPLGDVVTAGLRTSSSADCTPAGDACVLNSLNVNFSGYLTRLTVQVGETTATGTSRCHAVIEAENDTLGILTRVGQLYNGKAGNYATQTFQFMPPIDLTDPDTVLTLYLVWDNFSGSGKCETVIDMLGYSTPLD